MPSALTVLLAYRSCLRDGPVGTAARGLMIARALCNIKGLERHLGLPDGEQSMVLSQDAVDEALATVSKARKRGTRRG